MSINCQICKKMLYMITPLLMLPLDPFVTAWMYPFMLPCCLYSLHPKSCNVPIIPVLSLFYLTLLPSALCKVLLSSNSACNCHFLSVSSLRSDEITLMLHSGIWSEFSVWNESYFSSPSSPDAGLCPAVMMCRTGRRRRVVSRRPLRHVTGI